MNATLYTHAGDFHVDELIAISLLKRFVFGQDEMTVVRSRQKDVIAAAIADPMSFVVDVGLVHDPEQRNFDHHQGGGAGTWADGTPLSSCGLVWSWLRTQGRLAVIPDDELDRIEQDLIRPVDAHDSGVARWPLAVMFRMYNRQGAHHEVVQDQFMQALSVADELVDNQIYQAKIDISAEHHLQQAWDQCQGQGDGIVIVHAQLGNRSAHTLLGRLSGFQANLMVYPQSPARNNKKWYIRALPVAEQSSEHRVDFPPSMRGLHDAVVDLGDGSQAKFAFIHNSGFLAMVEGQLDDAYRVARAVLNHPENNPSTKPQVRLKP